MSIAISVDNSIIYNKNKYLKTHKNYVKGHWKAFDSLWIKCVLSPGSKLPPTFRKPLLNLSTVLSWALSAVWINGSVSLTGCCSLH